MLSNLLYLVLALLIFTTLYVVVRTLLFSLRQRAVEPAEGVPVDAQTVAEHLAASVRCRTVPLDDKGTPDPEAFAAASPDAGGDLPAGAQQAEARGHQRLQPALHLAGQPARPGAGHADGAPGCRVVCADPATGVDPSAVRRRDRRRLHLGPRHAGHQEPVDRHHGRGRDAARAGLPPGAHHPVRPGPRRGDRRGQWLQDHGADAQGARRPPGRDRG